MTFWPAEYSSILHSSSFLPHVVVRRAARTGTCPPRFCSILLPVSLFKCTTCTHAFIVPKNLNVGAYSKFSPCLSCCVDRWPPSLSWPAYAFAATDLSAAKVSVAALAADTDKPIAHSSDDFSKIQQEQQLAGSRLSVPPFVLVLQPTCVRFRGRAPFDTSHQLIVT